MAGPIKVAQLVGALEERGLLKSWRQERLAITRERPKREVRYVVESERFELSFEVYGPRAFAYFECVDGEAAARVMETLLVELELDESTIDERWGNPEDVRTFEVEVQWFPGPKWWE